MKNSLKILMLVILFVVSACQKEEFLVSDDGIESEAQKTNSKFSAKTKEVKNLIAKEWSKVANLKPRHSHTSLVFNDKMWIIGGKGDSDIPKNDVLYSENGKNWKTSTKNAPFKKRFHHASTVFKGKMWVIGGLSYDPKNNDNEFSGNSEVWLSENPFHNHFLFTNGYSALNDVWSSSDGIKWELVTSDADFFPRFSHSVTVFNGALWLFGGSSDEFGNVDAPYPNEFFNEVWRSYDGKSWTKVVNETPVYDITRHTALAFKDRLWLLGDDFQASDAIWSSKNAKEWALVDYPIPLGGSIFHQVLTVDDKNIWCFGFDLPTQSGNDMMYSSDGINWSRAELSKPFNNRVAHSSVFFKGKLWMINGWWRSNTSDKKGHEWRALSDIWSFEESNMIDDITSKTN